ncbi:MAG: acyltransferase [Nitrospiraceae bacterium]
MPKRVLKVVQRQATKVSRPPSASLPLLRWIEPIKAMAILAVVIVHVQAAMYDRTPWVLQASRELPNLWERLDLILPPHESIWLTIAHSLSMLGGNAPGVFIVVSGLTLAWSALHAKQDAEWLKQFYVRRALRIFPFYIAAHVIDLLLAAFLPGAQLQLEWPQAFLSLLGLRFTSELFSYFDPAWWFIWLILQLYLVFPALLWILRRAGIPMFLAVTLGITFACRIWVVQSVDDVQHWRMGITFVSRLAEFSVGMAVAQWVFTHRRELAGPVAAHTVRQFFLWSLGTYIAGLLAQTTLAGTVMSALLVSVGMTGIFWCLAELVLPRQPILASTMRWIGLHAYGIYLLHFLPFKWMVDLYPGSPRTQLLAFLAVFAGACFCAWLMELSIGPFLRARHRPTTRPVGFSAARAGQRRALLGSQ